MHQPQPQNGHKTTRLLWTCTTTAMAPLETVEKLIVTAVCCQIVSTCFQKTPLPWNPIARNTLKQVSSIMKNHIIRVIYGWSTPDYVKFEDELRVPKALPTSPSLLQKSDEHGESWMSDYWQHSQWENKGTRTQWMERMEIFIKMPCGKNTRLEVSKSDTILRLKKRITNREGILTEYQRLGHHGKPLDDEYTLYDYRFIDATTVHLLLDIKGGRATSPHPPPTWKPAQRQQHPWDSKPEDTGNGVLNSTQAHGSPEWHATKQWWHERDRFEKHRTRCPFRWPTLDLLGQ